jgi:hypothetical protein
MKLRRLITRRRARKTGKWAGLVLCVLLGVAFVLSRWVTVEAITISPSGAASAASVGGGRLILLDSRYPDSGLTQRQTSIKSGYMHRPHLNLWIDWGYKDRGSGRTDRHLFLPLWMPLLLLAAPTVWLWRVDRRAKPWQCAKCRYDLRGLEGGGEGGGDKIVCPECGSANGEG